MPPEDSSCDVFISYSRKDKALVEKIHAALEARGRQGWVDWEGIPPSEEWLATIHEAIDRSQIFVFVISPDSFQSRVCVLEELERAFDSAKKVVPVVARKPSAEDVPEAHAATIQKLRRRNYIFARESDDLEGAIEQLIEALETDFDHIRQHTEYLRSARLWEGFEKRASSLLRGDALDEAERWAAQGSAKDPSPSLIQIEYIQASRAAERNRKRLLTMVLTASLIVVSVLALFAVLGERRARLQTTIAEEQTEVAQEQTRRAEAAEEETAKQLVETQKNFARAEAAEKETAQQLRESQHQLGAVWLERAVKSQDRLDRSINAARAIGFTGYGRDRIEEAGFGEAFPVLLRPDSSQWQQAEEVLNEVHHAAPVWISPSNPASRTPYAFFDGDSRLYGLTKTSFTADGVAGGIVEYDLPSGEFLRKIETRGRDFGRLGIQNASLFRQSPDGRSLIISAMDQVLWFDPETETVTRRLNTTQFSPPNGMRGGVTAIDGSCRRLLLESQDMVTSGIEQHYVVQIASLETFEMISEVRLPKTEEGPASFAFSKDLNRLYLIYKTGLALEVDVATGDVSQSGEILGVEEELGSILMREDGSLLLLTLGGQVYSSPNLWEPFQILFDREVGDDKIWTTLGRNPMALSFEEKYLAITDSESTVSVFDLVTGERRLTADVGKVGRSLRFSPDGGYLLHDGFESMDLWETETWRELNAGIEEENSFREVFVSPSGRYVALKDISRSRMVWDTQEHRILTDADFLSPDRDHATLTSDEQFLWHHGITHQLKSLEKTIAIAEPIGVSILGLRSDGEPLIVSRNTVKEISGLFDSKGENIVSFPWAELGVASRDVGVISLSDYRDHAVFTFGNQEKGLRVAVIDAVSGELAGDIVIPYEEGRPEFALSRNAKLLVKYGEGPPAVHDLVNRSLVCELSDYEEDQGIMGIGGSNSGFAISPDGNLVATWKNSDSFVELWEGTSGRRLTRLRGHLNSVSDAAFSEDGRHLVSYGRDNRIIKWRLRESSETMEFVGDTEGLTKRIEEFNADDSIFIYNFPKGAERWRRKPVGGWQVTRFGIQEEGLNPTLRGGARHREFLIQGSGMNFEEAPYLSFFDWETGELKKELAIDTSNIQNPLSNMGLHIFFQEYCSLPENRLLATSGQSGVCFIDLDTGVASEPLPESIGNLGAVVSSDGRFAATDNSTRGNLKVWDLESQELIRNGVFGEIMSLSSSHFAPEKSWLAGVQISGSPSEGGTFSIWSIPEGEVVFSIDPEVNNRISSGCISFDSSRVAVGTVDGSIEVWDIETGEKELTINDAHSGIVSNVSFNPAGDKLVSSGFKMSMQGDLKLWSLSGNEVDTKNPWPYLPGRLVGQQIVGWDPDTNEIEIGLRDNILTGSDGLRKEVP